MFQEQLYKLRKSRGISQEELAGAVGVSRQAVQKWESGASRPDMDNLTAIADYFGVTLDYLIRGAEPAAPSDTPESIIINNHYYHVWHYEYRSKCTLFGLPLVHINVGRRNCWARGVFAVGNIATGVFSLGGISAGALSIGGLSAGVLALGGLALGGAALGAVAVGLLALGSVTVGGLALGTVANGVYAVGVVANGTQIAIGNLVSAPLAIGKEAHGAVTLLLDDPGTTPLAIEAAIRGALPRGSFLADWLSALASVL